MMNTEQTYVSKRNYASYNELAVIYDPQPSKKADERSAEIWRPLAELEDYYEVSSLGRLRYQVNGRLVPNFANPTQGAKAVFFIKHPVTGHLVTTSIKRAVALAFVPNPKGLAWTRYKDPQLASNTADNIEWIASPEQLRDLPAGPRKPYTEIVLDRLLREGQLSLTQRNLAGIGTALDDSMSPLLSEGSRFVAVPTRADNSLVGKVVAVVIRAQRFYCYLGRIVSITEDEVTVSCENNQWPSRTESRSVIRSIAQVVSVLEKPVC